MTNRPMARAKFRGVAAALLLTSALSTSHAAFAQSSAASAADEAPADTGDIVVTATRQSQSLSKVPLSVSVATAAILSTKNIRDVGDLARFTPGLTVDTGQTNQISIRGIASAGGASTTGIYIDDVPIQVRSLGSETDVALVKVFDLDRIEVLRGPQGTSFGSGSEGGTVRYITTQPSLTDFTGRAKLEGSYTQSGEPNYEAGVAIGGPIVNDVLGFRASIWRRRDGGYIDRIDPLSLDRVEKNHNFVNTTTARFSLLWKPTEWLDISPTVSYQRRFRNSTDIYWPVYSNPSKSKYVTGDPLPTKQPDTFYLPSLNVNADLGFAKLTSTTAYFDRTSRVGYDGTTRVLSLFQQYAYLFATDPVLSTYFPNVNTSLIPLVDANGLHIPANLAGVYLSKHRNITKQKNFSQELRLQSSDPAANFTWSVGLYYARNKQTNDQDDVQPQVDVFFNALYGANYCSTFGTVCNPDGSTFLGTRGDTTYTEYQVAIDKQYAAFAEASYKITPRLKLTAGVRIAKSKVSITDQTGGALPEPVFFSAKQSETPFTPKINLSYQLDKNNLFYGTYSTGFRPGGGNPTIPYQTCALDFQTFGIPGSPTSYNSDKVKSFEVGAKNNFQNRLRISTSAYYIKWNNIQQSVNPPICGASWIQNLGKATSKGFDLEASFLVSSALSLDLAAGYNEARFTKDAFVGTSTTALPIVRKGNAITTANGLVIPPWTVTVGGQYKFDVGDHPSMIRIDYQYIGGQKWKPAALDPGTLTYNAGIAPFYLPRRAQQFVSARVQTEINAVSVSFFVDNLLDAHKTLVTENSTPTYDLTTQALVASPLTRAYNSRPRTFGLAVEYGF